MSTPEEAFAYLSALKQILIYGGVSDADMEKGQMRCDVNISVRPRGQKEFGTKCELKNPDKLRRCGSSFLIRRGWTSPASIAIWKSVVRMPLTLSFAG